MPPPIPAPTAALASRDGGKISPTTAPPTAPQAAPLRALVEVIVDVDLPVGAAADEDEPVDLDHVVIGELLDGVPVASAASGSL